MANLKSPTAIYGKGFLFLLTGIVAGTLLLLRAGSWQVALLLAICVWSFCRFYYFAFYVIEQYVDGRFRFSGLFAFAKFLFNGHLDDDLNSDRDT